MTVYSTVHKCTALFIYGQEKLNEVPEIPANDVTDDKKWEGCIKNSKCPPCCT